MVKISSNNDNTITLTFSKNLVSDKYIENLFDYVRFKELSEGSNTTNTAIKALSDEIDRNYWQANKDKFLAKIKRNQ